MEHTGPDTSAFTYTVVGFVLLMVFVKLMTAMREEQKEGTRHRSRFINPHAAQKAHDDEAEKRVGDDEKKAPPDEHA